MKQRNLTMVHIQRWLQILWLLAATQLLGSILFHRGEDLFLIASLLWALLALGTALLFLNLASGLFFSCVPACLVLLLVGPWATRNLVAAIPQGSPLAIVEVLFYLILSVIPAILVLLLCWVNRRAFSGA